LRGGLVKRFLKLISRRKCIVQKPKANCRKKYFKIFLIAICSDFYALRFRHVTCKQSAMKNDFETCPVCGEKSAEIFLDSENNSCEMCRLREAQAEHWSQQFIREYEGKRILWRLQHVQSIVGQMEKRTGILAA
jgi:hypothetical protein